MFSVTAAPPPQREFSADGFTMPTSHPNQINEIIQIAELLRPASVLDVGVGYGKYGFLLREYLEANQRGKCADHLLDT